MSISTLTRIDEICSTISETYRGKDKKVILINTSDVLEGKILNFEEVENKNLRGQFKKTFKKNDILFSEIRPANKRFAFVNIDDTHNFIASTKLMVLRPNLKRVLPEFLYYILSSDYLLSEMQHLAETRSGTFPQITFSSELGPFEIELPDINCQRKIVSILKNIDEKIELNNEINDNLEQQLSNLFINLFAEKISNLNKESVFILGDLISVIDNRGKTPPLTSETVEYPIIDVGALKGQTRIVDFNNCTKFVSRETYNNWFRSGHPKEWDILLSTVGSLAEMKIYLGNKGCIAQNVVALRSKLISPVYLYQYLNYIRNDLIAYNIGSVQPSIKVTHIIKHPIYVPEKGLLDYFDKIARPITEQLFAKYNENEELKLLRDSLLPKLMSGEIDVDSIEL